MGIVGANEWKGGYQQYTSAGTIVSTFAPEYMETDSYLGKNMIVMTNTYKCDHVITNCSTVNSLPIFWKSNQMQDNARDRKKSNKECGVKGSGSICKQLFILKTKKFACDRSSK